uniref:Apple domain-containing protein n=1 Tax=Neospora caninum (strain Liverpool) TaxID=572307 RepID=A0A0F7UIW0_NEOCL|nr:TPA: hypothetical protein BN1204_038375 [Neospora caninum Liverpool]
MEQCSVCFVSVSQGKCYDHNRWITADNCRLSKDINYSSCRESCEQDETCKVWSYLSSGNLCKHCTSLHDWFSWERIPDAKSGRANSNVTSEDCQWHDVVFVPRLALTKQQEEPKRETLEACHDACRSRGTRYSWYSTEDVGHCICHDGDVEAIKFLGGVAGEYGDSGCDNNVYPEHRQPDDNGGCFMVNSTFDITDGKLCVKVACGSSLHASVGICTAKTCQKACQATPNMYEYFAYVPEGPVNNVDDDGESVCYCCKKSAQRTPAKKVLAGPRWCSGFSSGNAFM